MNLTHKECVEILNKIKKDKNVWCECIGNCVCGYTEEQEALSYARTILKNMDEEKIGDIICDYFMNYNITKNKMPSYPELKTLSHAIFTLLTGGKE